MCITILNTWKRSSSMRLLKRWIRWWRTTLAWICCNFASQTGGCETSVLHMLLSFWELAVPLRHETPASCRSLLRLSGCFLHRMLERPVTASSNPTATCFCWKVQRLPPKVCGVLRLCWHPLLGPVTLQQWSFDELCIPWAVPWCLFIWSPYQAILRL